ncbi:MAG TPA: outer membrane beta-barrel protein [Ignavibacteriaceae bacterium]|nr:outer membrane beta-barrel protein [Ignavibacteriaceae bacterium]
MKHFSFFIILFIASFSAVSFPQTFGIGGGLSTVQAPDAYTKDIIGGGLGLSSGYHIGAKLKLSIPLFPLTPVGSIIYSHFSGDQSTPIGDIKTSQSIWTIGAGAEYQIIPGPLSPYLAADLEYNNFGDLSFEGGNLPVTFTGSGSRSRLGIAIGIGAELTILPVIGLDAGIKYHFLNWFGKESGEETVSVMSYNLSIIF